MVGALRPTAMKNPKNHATLLLLASLPATALACFGSSSGGSTNPNLPPLDASTFDGSVEDAPADAPVADAAHDATHETSTPEAGTGPVTVKVLAVTGPEQGVAIVFGDATGAVMSSTSTDATGSASGTVPPGGGQVTVLTGPAAYPWLLTYTGVMPGETLNVIDPTQYVSSAVNVTDFPMPFPTATNWVAIIGSTSGTTGTSMPTTIPAGASFWRSLNLQQQFPVIVWGYDSSNTNELAYLFKKHNGLAADGGVATVSMAGLTWQSTFGTASVSASPVVESDGGPAGSNLGVSFVYSESSDGVPVGLPQVDAVLTGATATASFQTHPGYPDFVQLETDVTDTQATWSATQVIGTRSAPPAALSSSMMVDLTQALPEMSNPVVDATTSTRPTMTWSSPSMPMAAGTYVALAWNDVFEGGARYGSWTIMAAPGVTSVQAPALPASPLAPAAGATWKSGAQTIVTVQGGGLSSYADLRAAAGATFFQVGFVPTLPLLQANGTMLMSQLQGM